MANAFFRGMEIGDSMVGQFAPVASAIQTKQRDELANRMMAEAMLIPRAQAVGDDAAMVQSLADKKAERMPGMYTGGTKELEMRMALEKQSSASDDRTFDQNMQKARLELMQKQFKAAEDARADARTDAAFQQQTKQSKEAFDNALSYHTNLRQNLKLLGEAQTEDQYNQTADLIASLYNAAKASKLDVQPPQIPPFVSPSQRLDIQMQEQAVQQLQDAAVGKNLDGKDWFDFLPGPTRREKILAEQEKLRRMQPQGGTRLPAGPSAASLSPDPIAEAQQAIQRGADPAMVRARLRQMGIDDSALGQ